MDVLNNQVDPLILSRAGSEKIEIPSDWKRPFLETTSAAGPKIKQEKQEIVEFMDKDESMGEMYLAWRGNHTGDHLEEMVRTMNIPISQAADCYPLGAGYSYHIPHRHGGCALEQEICRNRQASVHSDWFLLFGSS
jgi:hypothetical protein